MKMDKTQAPQLLAPVGNLLNYSNPEIVINIMAALVIGVLLSVIYRRTHKGLSYSQSFTQSIIFVTVIVAIVMMVIGGSLARAFALVGAMSIIRFRTVLKDTKDMAYVFAALALGMAAGTSNYFLAAVSFAFISLIAVVLYTTNFGAVHKSEFIIRFRFAESGNSRDYLDLMQELCKRSNLLHMEPSADNSSLHLTFDITLKDDTSADQLTKRLGAISDVAELVVIASKSDVDY
jgi:uncharacterized membrane protein YhiD involved in acid resistance